jgi:sensor domain CHASE-containing protein
MNIRWKVTALIAALFTVLGVVEIFVAKTVLMPSFAELEHANANIAMRRVQYALDSTLDLLALSAVGWGNWTDAYRFMQDHNRTFVNENLTTVGLKQLNVNVLIYVDLDGQFVASDQVDLNADHALNLDFMNGNALAANFPWRNNLRNGRPARGFLQTNRGILMIATAPVLDGYGRGPRRGMVILGRLLTVAEIQLIGDRAQVDLAMLAPPNVRTVDRLIETDNVTRVYRSIEDIYARPIFTALVNVPRSITQRGRLAVAYASAYLASAAVIILVLLVFILNHVVLNPLARVTRHAVALGEGKDLTTRLDFKGTDEIGILACEFDQMVARVAEARSELIDQSFHAGFAELAKGVLHNLGNAMTPIGVRLSSLRDRLRSAPIKTRNRLSRNSLAGTVSRRDALTLRRLCALRAWSWRRLSRKWKWMSK